MDKQIWKFNIKSVGMQDIEMPVGAEILTIQTQEDYPCIWALVNPDAPRAKRRFEIFGTGHIVSNSTERKYIGTYQEMGGALIWHLFESL